MTVMYLSLTVIMGVNSSSFFNIWMMMEANMLSFIMYLYFLSPNINKLINYFMVQALASGALICVFYVTWSVSSNMSNLLSIPLLVKLGSAPFHLWLIKIMKMLNWKQIWVISVWQKILPLVMMMHLNIHMMLIMAMGTMNCVISSIMLPQQTSIKKLFVFSSIFTLGWIMVSITCNSKMAMMMLMMYGSGFLLITYMWNATEPTVDKSLMHNKSCLTLLGLVMISGLPPFSVFWAKMLIVSLLTQSSLMISIILLTSSLLALYTYINLVIGKVLMGLSILSSSTFSEKGVISLFMLTNILPCTIMIM